jgi:hypothetical protein
VQFNFLVDLGTGETDGPGSRLPGVLQQSAGRSRSPKYRATATARRTRSARSPGLVSVAQVSDVTLQSVGVIGSLALYQWLNDIRNGAQNALRTVRISLDERGPHVGVWMTWILLARSGSSSTSSGPFNAKGLRRPRWRRSRLA